MEAINIVPDVIDKAPSRLVQVTYSSGVHLVQGKELTPTQVKDRPTVTYSADPSAYYTLTMIDPDAPTRQNPEISEVRHWVMVNIPGNKVSVGQTLVEYIGSGPPQGTGLHRYIFLVFKQMGKLAFDEPYVAVTALEGRLKTNTRKFIEKYNLGNPVAGNFYEAQYDDYVPVLHASLS